MQPANQAAASRPRVVIVGAGFGGLSLAKALAHAPAEVLLIDRKNHHLFQPLLYQVATAGLSPAQIATPIRTILRKQANTRTIMGEVSGIDTAAQDVIVGGRRFHYDRLVVATGASHAYFGHDEWAEAAPGLKSLDDAVSIRRRVLSAFEQAELDCDPAEQQRLLTFVVVGAGPTGVEMAGAIAELAKRALTCDFRAVKGRTPRVVLVEAGPRVLPAFSERLSAYAQRALERLGVEVRTGEAVTALDGEGVMVGDERIEARTAIWGAGVRASPAGRWLGVETDRAGRVAVGPDLGLPGHPEISVIGDTSSLAGEGGKPLPGVAPVAKQQGEYLGRLITAELTNSPPPGPFRYRDFGILATIGRKAAVVQYGPVELKGFIAWVFWSLAHVYFLIGFRNRLAVTLDWLWAYLTYERGARLITGEAPAVSKPQARKAAA